MVVTAATATTKIGCNSETVARRAKRTTIFQQKQIQFYITHYKTCVMYTEWTICLSVSHAIPACGDSMRWGLYGSVWRLQYEMYVVSPLA